jgi:hypothetical protein
MRGISRCSASCGGALKISNTLKAVLVDGFCKNSSMSSVKQINGWHQLSTCPTVRPSGCRSPKGSRPAAMRVCVRAPGGQDSLKSQGCKSSSSNHNACKWAVTKGSGLLIGKSGNNSGKDGIFKRVRLLSARAAP